MLKTVMYTHVICDFPGCENYNYHYFKDGDSVKSRGTLRAEMRKDGWTQGESNKKWICPDCSDESTLEDRIHLIKCSTLPGSHGCDSQKSIPIKNLDRQKDDYIDNIMLETDWVRIGGVEGGTGWVCSKCLQHPNWKFLQKNGHSTKS